MIVAALLLSQAAVAAAPLAFRDTPAFAFTCRPAQAASTSPTYEYRVFLPVEQGPAKMPVRVELSKLDGVAKDMTSLSLERGLLWVFMAPGAAEGTPPMFKVNAVSGSPTGVFYDFQMIFTRSAANAPGTSGVLTSPSQGRLRITRAGDEQNFAGECTPIDTGSVQ